MADFLLEIGTEEIPSADLYSALEQLYAAFIELKQKQNLLFDEKKLEVIGTPRRLAVIIPDFGAKQADIESKKVKGPPAAAAFKDGKPTPAALGFAKAQGAKASDLKIEPTEKGDYLFAVTKIAGKPSEKILALELPALIQSLQFKKAMRWEDPASTVGASNIRFIRPIRWLVAMLDSRVVSFTLGTLKSSNTTYGHRLLHPGLLKIDKASNYKKVMQKAKVVAEPEKRARIIERALSDVKEGRIDMDDGRIQQTFCEVVNLVEAPSVLTGYFDKKFLKLPRKVVETVLQSHQRYFPIIESKKPALTNAFAVIHNGNPKNKELIKHGHEKVVKARLEDAEFYLHEDTQKKLSARVNDLSGIVFQNKLGTLLDKSSRLQYLVKQIAAELNLNAAEQKTVLKAAGLAKADLLTSMVGEFDELQGFIGAEYALREGEAKPVAEAIAEQYLPRHGKDILPKSKAGAVLSLADRIDTICAYISIGILPTSAGDPYALRRAATGIIDIILAHNLDLSVSRLAHLAYRRLAKDFKNLDKESIVVERVSELINQRLEFRLSQKGIDYDIIRAVAALEIEQPVDIRKRALSLQSIRSRNPKTLQDLITVFNRAYSIADSKLGLKVNSGLLKDKAEKAFYERLLKTEKSIDTEIQARKYAEAVKLLVALKTTVDKFFDDVLVMAKEAPLKRNRHALLNRFTATCLKVADLSKIVKT